jgi:mycothiol synthase
MSMLKRFDPDSATQEDFVATNKYSNILRAESMPDDPPTPLESTIRNMKSWKTMEKQDVHYWCLWNNREIIASVDGNIGHYDENRHLVYGGLHVLAEHRRQGIGTNLLHKIVEIAEANNRTLFVTNTESTVPVGQLFAERVNAEKGLELHTNQLVLAELDKSLLQIWIDDAKLKAKDFELGVWTDTYPEEDINDIAKLIEVMNDAPRGDLNIEKAKIKPEDLREWEAYNKGRGLERWELYVRHNPSGELAGFTSVYWNPDNPENLSQGNTGVIPKYRGHGLGKWLKAAMIQKVIAERPVVKRIRTGNADSNAPMLAINHALGFKPYIAETVWQIEIEKIKSYLQSTPT